MIKRSLLMGAAVVPLPLRKTLRRLPGVNWLVAKLLRRADGSAPLERCTIRSGPAKGLSLNLRLPQERAFWLGDFERPMADVLARTIKPGDVCWDIGAYIAYFAVLMASRSGAPVYCFEPLANNRQRIEEHSQLNHADIHLLSIALGEPLVKRSSWSWTTRAWANSAGAASSAAARRPQRSLSQSRQSTT